MKYTAISSLGRFGWGTIEPLLKAGAGSID
jgi:hypothetical protein